MNRLDEQNRLEDAEKTPKAFSHLIFNKGVKHGH